MDRVEGSHLMLVKVGYRTLWSYQFMVRGRCLKGLWEASFG